MVALSAIGAAVVGFYCASVCLAVLWFVVMLSSLQTRYMFCIVCPLAWLVLCHGGVLLDVYEMLLGGGDWYQRLVAIKISLVHTTPVAYWKAFFVEMSLVLAIAYLVQIWVNKRNAAPRYHVPLLCSILSFVALLCCSLWQMKQKLGVFVDQMQPGIFYNNAGYQCADGYIAHGGGILHFRYTNCKEAVCDSLSKGFKFVELDLLETDDGHILAAHDRKLFGLLTKTDPDMPLLEQSAKSSKIMGQYTPLTGADIYQIMMKQPEMTLVVDKMTNYRLLMKEIPLPDRIIVECFSPRGMLEAHQAGFKHAAFSVVLPSQLEYARMRGFKLLVVADDLLFSSPETLQQIQDLHRSGVCIFMHGLRVNSEAMLKEHLGRNVSKIYADFYSPQSLSD